MTRIADFFVIVRHTLSLTNLNESPRAFARVVRPWLGLGLEAKFSGLGLGLEAFGLGLGLGLVFLALALFKAKVRVTNILPNKCISV